MSILFSDKEKETRVPVSACHSTDRPKSDATMDLWLKHHFAQLYGPVADEPISADLLERLKACFG